MLHLSTGFNRLVRLTTPIDIEPSSPSSPYPSRRTLLNKIAHARLLTPFTHARSGAEFAIAQGSEIRTLVSDGKSIVSPPPTKTRDQTIDILDDDDLCIAPVDVAPLQGLFRRGATSRSPVTRLPPEILAYIFEFYVLCGDEMTPMYGPERGPACLTRVNKLWKSIAESDPHLWTAIHLHLPDARQSREEDVSRVKSVFDKYLKHSGALPMSLAFTDHRFYHAVTEELISLLVNRLRMHSCRWKLISLHLSCGYFPHLFTFMPCNLSSLEHLQVSGDVVGQRIVTSLRLDLGSAKNLKSLSYSGPGHALDDKIDVNWEKLEEVSFEFAPHKGMSSTMSRQFGHLAECKNITTCSLGIDRPFWLDLNGDETVTLPNLQTLRVRRLSVQSHARTVIDRLILPRLEVLEIDAAVLVGSDGRNPRWHDRNFSNLLARSGCPLSRLSIQDVDFPNDELMRCLAHAHALASFRFIPCPRSQDITDVLRALDASASAVLIGGRKPSGIQGQEDGQKRVGDGPLVPGLREIELASSVEGYLDLVMVICRSREGARARVSEVAALRRLDVTYFDTSHGHGSQGFEPVRGRSVTGDRGDRLKKVAGFRSELVQWAEEENARATGEGGRVETSVVVNSPYLVEYINIV